MSEDMNYYRATEVLSTLIHRRGDPEESRAYLTVLAEVMRLKKENADLRQRPRGVQIGDYGTQTNHF